MLTSLVLLLLTSLSLSLLPPSVLLFSLLLLLIRPCASRPVRVRVRMRVRVGASGLGSRSSVSSILLAVQLMSSEGRQPAQGRKCVWKWEKEGRGWWAQVRGR